MNCSCDGNLGVQCTGGVECTDILIALSDVVCIMNVQVEWSDVLIALSDIVCIMNVQVERSMY